MSYQIAYVHSLPIQLNSDIKVSFIKSMEGVSAETVARNIFRENFRLIFKGNSNSEMKSWMGRVGQRDIEISEMGCGTL